MEHRNGFSRRTFLGGSAATSLALAGTVAVDASEAGAAGPDSFDFIQTPGGSGGPTVVVNDLASVNEAWFAPDSGDTTRPVVVKIDPSVTGVVPYHNRGATNGFLGAGDITLVGHPDVILGVGGNRRFGFATINEGKLADVVLQDLNFYPGVHPIADPTAPTNDSRSGTDQMPFYGATEPAEGWGQTFQNRDALHIYHADRLILRHCTFAYGIDEALEMFRQNGRNGRVIRNVLVENCFIGLSLANPTDGGVPHGGEPRLLHDPTENRPHNFGALLADGDRADRTKVQNIVFRNCVFASNRRRNPGLGIADAVTVDNCLIVHWGDFGTTIRNPSSNLALPTPARVLLRNNLYQPGPRSNTETVFGVIRCGTTETKLYLQGNYLINPGDQEDWTGNQMVGPRDVNLQPSSGGASNPDVIVHRPPFRTAYTKSLRPTDTASDRKNLYDYILHRVGPRWRNASGEPLLGDANTSFLLQWALPKIRDGSIPHIRFPEDATGYQIG